MKLYRSLSLAAVLLLMFASVALAQERTVSGQVTDETGNSMPGVNVLLKGSSNGTATDVDGNFKISIPDDAAVLTFTFVGYATSEMIVGQRTVVNIQLTPDVTTLTELVVTGYTTEKRADIIGAVAVVKTSELLATPSANLQSQLQGRAAGVTVSGSGQPGAGAKVRIRGFASFGNNDPLYVIDGVPTENPGTINPQDIENVNVLKDATSASIYGSRAANGVVIITTKKGKAGTTKITVDSYVGTQWIPESTFPKMASANQIADYQKRAWATAVANDGTLDPTSKSDKVLGSALNPSLPDYIAVNGNTVIRGSEADAAMNPSLYNVDPNAGRGGPGFYQILKTNQKTDWFKQITRNAPIKSYQISASGGNDKGIYSLGLNYFTQDGTIKYNGYKRYSVRANTMFKPVNNVRVGENMQISHESRQGNDQRAEGGAWAQAYRIPSYVPVYDIKGGYGGSRMSGDNGNNPLANLYRGKDNTDLTYRIFGNVFAEVDLLKDLTFRTSYGIDYRTNTAAQFGYMNYENSEGGDNNSYTHLQFNDLTWTWTNTLTYQKTIGSHNLKVFGGIESIKAKGDNIYIRRVGYDINDPEFMSTQTSNSTAAPTVNNTGWDQSATASPYDYRNTLYSFFGRLDYGFKDKYLFNATIRRDESSKFGPNSRTGVFPAFGVAWRISQEDFMSGISAISDLKLRAGWGQMGSQKNVDAKNQYTFYKSTNGASWYPSNGGTVTIPGYKLDQLGNPNTKWETTQTMNIAVDASLLGGKLDISADYYVIDTKDLLVDQQLKGSNQSSYRLPKINIGTMRNKGIDITLTNRGTIIEGLKYDATLTFTHYTNELIKYNDEGTAIYRGDGSGRLGNIQVTEKGHAISTFYGYQTDGFFKTPEEIAASATQNYAIVGAWKFKDNKKDGVINDDDRTYLGSPIPKMQLGLNAGLAYKGFDLSAFFFWNYGNKIYNFTKWFKDLRGFPGGVSEDVVNDSWTPAHQDAKLPILNSLDTYSNTISSDFYVETGSYLRLKTLQIGYKIPKSVLNKIKLDNLRIYVQGQNLFTITKYTGADPDVAIQSNGSNTTDDLTMGIDRSGFPNPRQVLVGVNLTF